ncbi:hypothetical protein BS78_07G114600 [Paspalum vaginatum]|nr:hypothetical protein BS78_07G114600 [Paspalum vaginatum]
MPPFPFCTSTVGPDGRRGAGVRGIRRAATDGEGGAGHRGTGRRAAAEGAGAAEVWGCRGANRRGCPTAEAGARGRAAAVRRRRRRRPPKRGRRATACWVPGTPGRADNGRRGGDARDGRPGGAGRTSLHRASKVSATGHPTPVPRSSRTPPAAA